MLIWETNNFLTSKRKKKKMEKKIECIFGDYEQIQENNNPEMSEKEGYKLDVYITKNKLNYEDLNGWK